MSKQANQVKQHTRSYKKDPQITFVIPAGLRSLKPFVYISLTVAVII
ncbi:MAG: hypothetical protein ACQEXX_12800 [Bacillota bacterium]